MHVKRVTYKRALCAGAAAVALTAMGGRALAQGAPSSPPPPVAITVDDNGVDLGKGKFVLADTQVSIGPADEGGLARVFSGDPWRDNFTATLNSSTNAAGQTVMTVSFGGQSAEFIGGASGPFTRGVGAANQTLTFNGQTYLYTAADGTEAVFSPNYKNPEANAALVLTVTRPDGERLTYHWGSYDPAAGYAKSRLMAVTNNLGYMIKYEYVGSGDVDGRKLSRVTAFNLALVYCDPQALTCDPGNYYTASFSNPSSPTDGNLEETDARGYKTTYTYVGGRITSIVRPGNITEQIEYYDASNDYRVKNITTVAGTWHYDWTLFGSVADEGFMVTVTDPLGHQKKYGVYGGEVSWARDGLYRETQFGRNELGQLDQVFSPEGNFTKYIYEVTGGRLIAVQENAKPGSGQPRRDTFYSYKESCTPKTCNKPITVIVGGTVDSNQVVTGGVRTDYSYDDNTGQLLTVTGPSDAVGYRPTTTYQYAQLTANFNAPPNAAPSPVSRLMQTSTCVASRTGCVNTEDEARTVYARNGADNLQPQKVTRSDGAGKLAAATTTIAYNRFGDVRNVIGPEGGTGRRLRYDKMRNLVGIIEADPDGLENSGKPSPAQRIDYTANGQVNFVQYGTVASQSDTDFNDNFTKLYTRSYNRDAGGRVVGVRLFGLENSSTGIPEQLTNYSYNGQLLECVAVRMNRDAFATLVVASSGAHAACKPGTTGADGPDRITHFQYDAADELTRTTQAEGTGNARSLEQTYTRNGQLETLTDGNLNRTTFVYDGFDRLSRTNFPSPTAERQSSDTDYASVEQYDPSTWLPTRVKLRNGATQVYGYDPAGQLASVGDGTTVKATYDYDNMGHLVRASASGLEVTQAYDALGRLSRATSSSLGTLKYDYDAAGRRVKLTWPDNVALNYEYNKASQLTAMYFDGQPHIVDITYDDASRRDTLIEAGLGSITYHYDKVSRVRQLDLNPTGAAADGTITLAYNAASQIIQRTTSNPAFSLSQLKGSHSYTVDRRNQLTTVDGGAVTYQGGNLTSWGGKSYSYNEKNQLNSDNGVTLAYDPADRLYQIGQGSGSTHLLYDGDVPVAEYDATTGALVTRYVQGPGLDEPLVSLDAQANRSGLFADERGSIAAVSSSTGATVNTYDEYGLPGPSNVGRFQYTGQIALPQGLYHYKARAYSPDLGRFLQADPLGYDESSNLYTYVLDDPISRVDPTGLEPCMWVPGLLYGTCDGTTVSPPPPPDLAGIQRTFEQLNDIYSRALAGLSRQAQGAAAQLQRTGEQLACRAPTVSGGGGVDAYAGLGTSASTGFSVNPRNGQISLSLDLGVGVGAGGGARANWGTQLGGGRIAKGDEAHVVGGGVNINATGVAGPLGATGSYQLVGSNQGDWSMARTAGGDVSGNINVSAHVQVNGRPLYHARCK